MEKEIGCVLSYRDLGSKGIGGQQVGADGSGDYCVIFKGEPIDAEKAAHEYVKKYLDPSFMRFTNITIIPMIDGYYGIPIKIIDVNEKKDFRIEIVNHETGDIIKTYKGSSDELLKQFKDILENLTEEDGIKINVVNSLK